MVVFGVMSVSIWWITQISLWSLLQPLVQPLQQMCVWQFETPRLAALGGAMVCGQELAPGELRTLFLQLGIYHVLVVSGAHLVFLSQMLNAWQESVPGRTKIIAVLLLMFAFMTGLQAPVLRAGLQMILRLRRLSHPLHDLATSYALCLVLHPPWITSASLHLSFLAALGILLPFNFWIKSLSIVFLTLPLIVGFGTFNAPGSLWGIVLSPVVELLFFPICGLAWLMPFLQSGIDGLLQFTIWLLESLRPLTGAPLKVSMGMTGLAIPIYSLGIFSILRWLHRSPRDGQTLVRLDFRSEC